jgi:hypothetical protein
VTVFRTSPVAAGAGASPLPQFEQNRASSVFSRPHLEQVITGRV